MTEPLACELCRGFAKGTDLMSLRYLNGNGSHLRDMRESSFNDAVVKKMASTPRGQSNPALTIEEIRIIADLRIMHAKVDELYHVVQDLKRRHSENSIHAYSDKPLLAQDIQRVDEIYLWFVKLREQRERLNGTR